MSATSKHNKRFLKLNSHIFNTFIGRECHIFYTFTSSTLKILFKKVIFNFQSLLNLQKILKKVQLQPRINFSQINDF